MIRARYGRKTGNPVIPPGSMRSILFIKKVSKNKNRGKKLAFVSSLCSD